MSSSTLSHLSPSGGRQADPKGVRNALQEADAVDADSAPARLFRPDPTLDPGLYIVSTPIGNLRDITLRALDVLASVDMVYAEDTRIARKLFDAYGLSTPLNAYHDHNGAKVRPKILGRLAEGAKIALISDAGTPLVSDPGFKLVRDAAQSGERIIPVPGASAQLAALAASGLPTDRFLFVGFPPPKSSARATLFAELAGVSASLVFFEGPSRLAASLADMAAAFGAREAVLARELTKKFEELVRAPLPELLTQIGNEGAPKGELVVLIGPPPALADAAPEDIDAAILSALSAEDPPPVKQLAAQIADRLGAKKRDVYARILALKDDEAR
ncbi:MAG: 16S rRNA (cytidine(1402)-2'-O)-methyltransferase [Pseudomonadota bacterium]